MEPYLYGTDIYHELTGPHTDGNRRNRCLRLEFGIRCLYYYLEPNLFEDGNGLLILDMHHSNSFLLDIFPMSLECWKQLFCSVGHIIIPKHLPYELPLPSSPRKWISIKPKETWEKKKREKRPPNLERMDL